MDNIKFGSMEKRNKVLTQKPRLSIVTVDKIINKYRNIPTKILLENDFFPFLKNEPCNYFDKYESYWKIRQLQSRFIRLFRATNEIMRLNKWGNIKSSRVLSELFQANYDINYDKIPQLITKINQLLCSFNKQYPGLVNDESKLMMSL